MKKVFILLDCRYHVTAIATFNDSFLRCHLPFLLSTLLLPHFNSPCHSTNIFSFLTTPFEKANKLRKYPILCKSRPIVGGHINWLPLGSVRTIIKSKSWRYSPRTRSDLHFERSIEPQVISNHPSRDEQRSHCTAFPIGFSRVEYGTNHPSKSESHRRGRASSASAGKEGPFQHRSAAERG